MEVGPPCRSGLTLSPEKSRILTSAVTWEIILPIFDHSLNIARRSFMSKNR